MKNVMVVFGLALSIASVACAGVETAEDEGAASESALDSRPPTTNGVTEGGGCKINSGSNAGTTGTYSKDMDGYLWCCSGANGTGSCTECTSTGGGACTATSTAPPKPPIRRYDFATTTGTFTAAP